MNLKHFPKVTLTKSYSLKISGNIPILVITEITSQGTLHEWLRTTSQEPANLKKVVSIAKQVAQGMHVLHSCKPPIIHHNLKTSNVLVTRYHKLLVTHKFTQSWNAKITDFYLGNRALKEYRAGENFNLKNSRSDEISREEREDRNALPHFSFSQF
jgi:serine/threonine protein kinase